MSFVFGTAIGGLLSISFQGDIVYGEAPESVLSPEDLRFLVARYDDQMATLMPYIQRHHSHVYVPLSEPQEGYHVSFSGCFCLKDLQPFFRHAPNALTVVDGRPWGLLRIRLIAVAEDLY